MLKSGLETDIIFATSPGLMCSLISYSFSQRCFDDKRLVGYDGVLGGKNNRRFGAACCLRLEGSVRHCTKFI